MHSVVCASLVCPQLVSHAAGRVGLTALFCPLNEWVELWGEHVACGCRSELCLARRSGVDGTRGRPLITRDPRNAIRHRARGKATWHEADVQQEDAFGFNRRFQEENLNALVWLCNRATLNIEIR